MAFTVDIPAMGVTNTRAVLHSAGNQLYMQVRLHLACLRGTKCLPAG
jgi:hypothetical protein